MRGSPSNSELRRWLRKGNVVVNRRRLEPGDIVHWPIRQILFFPKSPDSRTTIWYDYEKNYSNDWWEGPSNGPVLRAIVQGWEDDNKREAALARARGDIQRAELLEQGLLYGGMAGRHTRDAKHRLVKTEIK